MLQDEIFFYTLFGLYGAFYYFLPLVWAVLGVFGFSTLILIVIAQLNGEAISWSDAGTIFLFGGAIGGSLLALWINGIINQSTQRQELVEELEQAQANLVQSERKAGQLAERQRLAQDIHDTLAQGFISIIMNLETAESFISAESNEYRYVSLSIQTARDSLDQARRVVADLRPQPLEQTTSLPEAIRRVAERWQKESGTAVDFLVTGDHLPLQAEMDVVLLRAAQEALANVRKHANANLVTVTLSYTSDLVILDVQDNGDGFDDQKEAASFRKRLWFDGDA